MTAPISAAAVLGGQGLPFDLTLNCDGAARTLRCPVDGVQTDGFAQGALRAAQFLMTRPQGLYDMWDVLELN